MEKIEINVDGFNAKEIERTITTLSEKNGFEVNVKQSSIDFGGFSLDPATIIVSGAGVLSTLITAFFAYLATKKMAHLLLQVRAGEKSKYQKIHQRKTLNFR